VRVEREMAKHDLGTQQPGQRRQQDDLEGGALEERKLEWIEQV
jgi:hypothetical protein